MPSFRIIHDLATPGFYHADKHIWIFGTSDAFGREHLGIVASDMFHNPQRFSGFLVDEFVLAFGCNLHPVLVDEVAGMHQELWLCKFQFAGFPEVVGDLLLEFGIFPPCFQCLAVQAERRDAGAYVVLVAVFFHQCKLPGNYGHGSFLRNGVRVVGYAAAGGVMFGFKYIFAKLVPCDVKESGFRCRKERLPDAASDVEIVVVRYFFLVLRPDFLFSFVNHQWLKCLGLHSV